MSDNLLAARIREKSGCRASAGTGKDTLDSKEFAALCKALGHPARMEIVTFLKQYGRCLCGRIVEMLPLAQSTVSQHLKILKEAGLIQGEVEGSATWYCLDLETLDRFKRRACLL